jgi:membrane-associated phospholipid phosphatase
VLAGLVVNLVLKGLTGRTSPEATLPAGLPERSQSFAFGFLRGGLLEGWPSGHAMTNTALAAGLWTAFPSRSVRAAATAWAAWVLVAVVFGIQGEVHWLSYGIAGSALGWWFGTGYQPTESTGESCHH